MVDKLHISDVSKLRITKINDWKVCFIYEDVQYLLKITTCDYETGATLYLRNSHSSKDISAIKGCYSKDSVYGEFIKKNDCGKTYSQIDLNYFVKRMTIKKLITSYIPLSNIEDNKNKINARIKSLREIIRSLELDIYNLEH